MGVVVLLPQIGLVHVRMRVLGSVVVAVGVVVLDMFVVVAGVRVRVSNFVVAMFVRVRFVVTVLMLCHCHPLCCRDPGHIYCALRDAPWEQLTASSLVCIPRGARGVEQCAWPSGARLRDSAVISRA